MSSGAVAIDGGIASLKPLYRQTSLGTRQVPHAVIVAGPKYEGIARELQQKIRALTDISLTFQSDEEAFRNPAYDRNLIVLGQFGDNKVIEHFYYRWYLVADGLQPGPGGYVLQTVHNPDALGINVVLLGGSDRTGVAQAVARFAELVKEHGKMLPHLFEVQLGLGKEPVLERGRQILAPDREWPTLHPMEVQKAIGEVGMLYLYTADKRYAEAYKQQLTAFLERTNAGAGNEGISDDFDAIIITWDLLEEDDIFSDAERLWITSNLWEKTQFIHSPEETNYRFWLKLKDQNILRENHRARYATSLYFACRYFLNYYGKKEVEPWLEEIRTFYRPQMTCSAVKESRNDMARITLDKAMVYAVAENVASFMSPEVLGVIADKSLAETVGNRYLGGSWNKYSPGIAWALAAHQLDNPKYLWPMYSDDRQMSEIRLPWLVSWEIGRSFWDGTTPADELAVGDWLVSVPVAQLRYDESPAYGPKNVPANKAFSLLVLKDPLGRGGQYLSIGGDNTGSYCDDSANAIRKLHVNGTTWLRGDGRIPTIHKQNSVSIVRNGDNQKVPAFACLDRSEATDKWAITRTSVRRYNGTDWYRNIVNIPNEWFLVIDEVDVNQSGDFILESRWGNYAHGGFDDDDFVLIARAGTENKEHTLRITGTGWASQYAYPWLYSDYLHSPLHSFVRRAADIDINKKPYYTIRVARRWTGYLAAGQKHVFANLLHVHLRDQKPLYRLEKMDSGEYWVHGASKHWQVATDETGAWAVTERAFTQRTSGVPPAASSANLVSRDTTPGMSPRWSRTEDARILSSAVAGLNQEAVWAVGLSDGRIRLRDSAGAVAADMGMPGMVWAMTSVDLDNDGADELLAGSDTGGVTAFTAAGELLWTWAPPPWAPLTSAWRQSMGQWRPIITNLQAVDIQADGVPEILAVGVYFYVLDNQGNLIAMYDAKGELDVSDNVGQGTKLGLWRTPEYTFMLACGDVDGDGQVELAGDIPLDYQVRIWNAEDARRLAVFSKPWNRSRGTALKQVAAADIDADGKDEFVTASDGFHDQLAVFDHPEGLRWSVSVGAAAERVVCADLTDDGKPEIIVGTGLGQVQAFDESGERLFYTDLSAQIASLIVIPSDAGAQIWAGTIDGKIYVLDCHGRVLGRALLETYVDNLVCQDKAVLATTAEGNVAVFAVE